MSTAASCLIAVLLVSIITGGVGVFFTKMQHTATLLSSNNGQNIFKFYCYSDFISGVNSVNFTLSDAHLNNERLSSNPFVVKSARNNSLAIGFNKSQLQDTGVYKALITCADSTTSTTTWFTLNVLSNKNNERCQGVRTSFVVSEHLSDIALGRLSHYDNDFCSSEPVFVKCEVDIVGNTSGQSYNEYVTIDKRSLDVKLLQRLDHEQDSLIRVMFVCQDTGDRVEVASITVTDINDSGPFFENHGRLFKYDNLTVHHISKDQSSSSYVFQDLDDCSMNHYTISSHNDYLNIMMLSEIRTLPVTRGCWYYFSFTATVDMDDIQLPYVFQINVTDTSFIPINMSDSATAVFTVNFEMHNVDPRHSTNIQLAEIVLLSTSARYTRMHVMKYQLIKHYQYFLEVNHTSSNLFKNMFRITGKEGIVYLDKPDKLQSLEYGSMAVLHVFAKNDSGEQLLVAKINVAVQSITDTSSTSVSEDSFCAFYNTEQSCVKGTGLGSPSGRCVWRESSDLHNKSTTLNYKPTRNYSTCSPSLLSCPNFHCDELERMIPTICPQDCITTPPIGMAHLNDKYSPHRGILAAEGPCWCTKKLETCYCMRNFTYVPPDRTKTTTKTTDDESDQISMTALCDGRCFTIVVSCLGSVIVVGLFGGVTCWWYISHIRASKVGSRSGMSAEYAFGSPLTVEYVTPLNTSESNNEWMHHHFMSALAFDPKWEVNRAQVDLESTIGEGEFGRVVKAKVSDLQGTAGTTVVAVKMLKECATQAEYRDLVSEFNLLKEVSHRNVIKLLAICSRDGPFYLIVEFCEHGSLRSFLRNSRQKYGNTPPLDGEAAFLALNDVSVHDLLLFAWQIAKGMEYLSEMKVVHRDLAARNVLVAAGMVVKISDFGLSRDIYEDDAYLKTTKGPLPVKWMAPESLFDQLYTTKSDVWSYGIVLWEIVTLGANPYPGIAAEYLCHLLKTGYRMDKPQTCSEELYSVMMQCWQIGPTDRPSFKQLSNLFEQFLSKDSNVAYLDLSAMSDGASMINVLNASGIQMKDVNADQRMDHSYKIPVPVRRDSDNSVNAAESISLLNVINT